MVSPASRKPGKRVRKSQRISTFPRGSRRDFLPPSLQSEKILPKGGAFPPKSIPTLSTHQRQSMEEQIERMIREAELKQLPHKNIFSGIATRVLTADNITQLMVHRDTLKKSKLPDKGRERLIQLIDARLGELGHLEHKKH